MVVVVGVVVAVDDVVGLLCMVVVGVVVGDVVWLECVDGGKVVGHTRD